MNTSKVIVDGRNGVEEGEKIVYDCNQDDGYLCHSIKSLIYSI